MTGQRIIRQRVVEAALALEVVAVGVEEVGRLLRLAERFHAVLADFERERRGDVVHALLDELADTSQQSRALGRCGPPPLRPGGVCGAQRLVGIRGAGRRECSDLELAVRGTLGAQQLARAPLLAGDVQRVARAELVPGARHTGLEAFVQLLGRAEHGGVGELETHEQAPAAEFTEQSIEEVQGIGELALGNDERWREQDEIAPRREGYAGAHPRIEQPLQRRVPLRPR